MHGGKLTHTLLVLGAGLVAICFIAGCASQTKVAEAWWGDRETGIILEHRMPDGEALSYELTSDFLQTMEIMGNAMEVVSEQYMAYTITPRALEGESQRLGMTIDDFALSISMPQGDMVAAADDVIGAEFEMTLSTLGVESNYEKADEIRYDLGIGGTRGLGTEFSALFIDMPGEPVKIGDSWNSTTTIVEDEEGSGTLELVMNGVNTLAGFEVVDDYECARIETEFTGTMKGKTVQGGATVATTGELSGSGTTHFAYKKGLVVSEFSMGVADGEMKVEGPQKMTIPLSREFTTENTLVVPGEGPRMMKNGATKVSAKEKKDATPVEKKTPADGTEPKILTAGPLTVVGVRERFESTEQATPEAFEDLWMNRFMPHQDVLLPLSTNKGYYGVTYAIGEGESFYYLAGMAVADDTDVPEGLFVHSVPEAEFAVFETDMTGIGETWGRIFGVWLPGSAYEHDRATPCFEEYPPETDESPRVLIYVPVVSKK